MASTPSSSAPDGKPERRAVIHLNKLTRKRNPKKSKKLNMTRNRLTKEDKKAMKYEHFEKLYLMWKEYYGDLLGEPERHLDDRMLKADYHGALLLVIEADNPTMVDTLGIVVLETRYTFQLITKENKYVVIPKQGTTFQFVLRGRVLTLFGDALKYKPALRGKKQRLRGALPFLLR